MINNLIKNTPWLEYVLGIIVYFILISNQQFSLGIVWLIFVLYGWTIISILVQSYSLQSFIYALCGFGIIIAITLFFMNGVQEVPFPKGAVQFKLDGIAQSLVVFFIFTVPLIVYQQQTKENAQEESSVMIEKKPDIEKTQENNNLEDNNNSEWEEATTEDLESGRFEPI